MENILINIIFTIIMLGLAVWDFVSYGKQKHRDFKSIIMSTGVLGTFVGIFVGLQDFNVNEIEKSVPFLLEGLKTAFYTSILGMSLAIILAIIQKGRAVKSDFENMMDYFSLQVSKLDELNKIKDIVEYGKKNLDFQREYYNTQKDNFSKIESYFHLSNQTLKEAMQHLAQGASKELISALEGVIRDFNKRITDQFGDNFKELNAAVSQMILWQSNYKDSIVQLDENLKNTLKVFCITQESLEMIAKRNEEVLGVYNALAHTIESSRIENEKLSGLLAGFKDMHKDASSALGAVNELTQVLQEAHLQALNHTRNNMSEIRGFLTQTLQEHKSTTKEVLAENLKVLENDYLKASENLLSLQKQFEEFNSQYLTQNKENLQNAISEFEESNIELKNRNLEMMGQTQENIQKYLESIKQDYLNSLSALKEVQQESLLLIEEQAKQSNHILTQHTNNLEVSLKDVGANLEEMSAKVATNLTKNSETLEQHMTNAVLNFDALLGNTTKTLQENLQESKNTLVALSKEIEDAMSVVTKSLDSLLNDTANSLSKSTQNIEESLVFANQTISDSFSQTAQEIGKSVHNLLEYNQKNSQEIQEIMKKNVATMDVNLTQMTQNIQKYYQEIQDKMRASFGESYKNAIESFGAYIKNSTNAYQNQLVKFSQNNLEVILKNHSQSLESHEKIHANLQQTLMGIVESFNAESKQVIVSAKKFSQELLSASGEQLKEHSSEVIKQYSQLELKIKDSLQEMAQHYLGMLSTLTQQSIELPKNVSVELLNEFNKLQKNLGEALEKTYFSLESSHKGIEEILRIIQSNVSSSLTQTSNLNENLCKSLGELDGALSNITLGFRQDYEWFLRRIKELMGARN